MTRVALLDYGMGNLHSAAKALEHVGATVDDQCPQTDCASR